MPLKEDELLKAAKELIEFNGTLVSFNDTESDRSQARAKWNRLVDAVNTAEANLGVKPMSDCEDIIRVVRVLEYIGRRKVVEGTLAQNSVQGIYKIPGMTIREAILGSFPETISEEVKTDA